MKKFLSLMLAMIMVMSLVTVGAGAAFTDAEEIQYVEAVELMTGLGILSGSGDGSFNPQGNLTRAAAAKIIAYIALGAEAADKMTYDKVIFPDVELTSSTAPYIAWCAEQGIINGYTDGTFGRKNAVSGHAFLKMVLGALGIYGQYTGTGWQTIVTAAAKEAKLLEGLSEDIVLSQNLTREAACQIAFNAMNHDKKAVKGYLVDGTLFDTLVEAATYINLMKLDTAPKYVFVEGGKLLEEVHKVETAVTGVIVENSANADTKYTKIGNEYYAVETGLAQLGNTVKVYFKEKAKDTDEAYPVVSLYDECKEVAVTKSTKADALKTALAAAGITKSTEKVTVKYVDAAGAIGEKEIPAITLGETKGETLINVTNETLTLIVSGKKIVGAKAQLAKSLDKVSKVEDKADEAYITFATAGKLENGVKDEDTDKVADIVNAYEGIAKDDIVVITKIGKIYNVEKVQTVTGKPTKINGTTVTIDGVAYAKKGTGTAGKTPVAAADMAFDKEYTLYLDGQGNYIIAVAKTTSTTKTKVFFLETNKYTTLTDGKLEETTFAKVVLMDGTIAEYKVADGFTKAQGTYEISANTKGVYTTWTEIGEVDANGVATADKSYKDGTDNYYYADTVKFIAIEKDSDGKWTTEVRTGKQKVEEAVTYIATAEKDEDGKKTGNYTINTVIFVGDFDADAETVKDIVYAVETKASTALVPYTNADGKTDKGYEHTVYVDGVKTTIIVSFKKTVEGETKFDADKSAAAIVGFITLTKDGEAYTYADKTGTALKETQVVTNVYGTMITAGTVVDIDAADAEIIDLRTGSNITKVTTIAGLKGRTISFVIDEKADPDVVATIYVIG